MPAVLSEKLKENIAALQMKLYFDECQLDKNSANSERMCLQQVLQHLQAWMRVLSTGLVVCDWVAGNR